MNSTKNQNPNPKTRLKVPTPQGICKRCALDPLQTKTLPDAPNILASYCPHNRTGGLIVLNGDRPLWRLFTPLTSAEWAEWVFSELANAKHEQAEARHAKH